MTKKATPLRRRISDWLEVTGDARVPTGISPAAALRRAHQLRRDVLRGETGPNDVVLDDDFKSVLYALVQLIPDMRPASTGSTEDVKRIQEFLRGLRWPRDTFDEKTELLRQLELYRARNHILFSREREPDDSTNLPPGDLFRTRPNVARGVTQHDTAILDQTASDAAKELASRIIDAAFGQSDDLPQFLVTLNFLESETQIAILLALRDVGLQITRDPMRLSVLSSLLTQRLERDYSKPLQKGKNKDARIWRVLLAWTYRLEGMVRLHTGDFGGAGPPLRSSYRLLASSSAGTFDLASVEIVESQRRSFLGRGNEGLELARRVENTYRSLGLEAGVARAKVARGIALAVMGRHDDAVVAYREAIPEFEKQSLWSNYIGAVNSLGVSLTRLNRLDKARREYARALGKLSPEKHRSWIPLVRQGLAELLFASGRFREAARSFGMCAALVPHSSYFRLKWMLQEIESWGRAGDFDLANQRLDQLRRELGGAGPINSTVLLQIQRALRIPDLERLTRLRQRAERGLMVQSGRTSRPTRFR